MSAICSSQSQSGTVSYLITVKGAPEVLQGMFTKLPEGYQTLYSKLTRQGARVLALGYRYLGNLSQREVCSTLCMHNHYQCRDIVGSFSLTVHNLNYE